MDYWDNRWDKDLDDEKWRTKNKPFWTDEDEEEDPYPSTNNKKLGPRKFSLDFLSKVQKQTIAAVLLFFVVLSAKYDNDLTSGLIYGTFRTALSPQNDYSLVLNEWVKDFASGEKLVSATNNGNMLMPVNGNVINGFGWQVSPLDQEKRYNTGIDIAASLGTYVQAPQAGTIVKVGSDAVWGRYVKIDHGNGYTSLLSNFGEVSIKVLQKVKKGDQLGTLGFTAAVKRPWLHWEVRRNNQPVDPQSMTAKPTKT